MLGVVHDARHLLGPLAAEPVGGGEQPQRLAVAVALAVLLVETAYLQLNFHRGNIVLLTVHSSIMILHVNVEK